MPRQGFLALIAFGLLAGGGWIAPPGLTAAQAAEAGEMTEAWLYLGRRSEGRWKPASDSIAAPRYPLKTGARIVVRRDAMLYGAVDCVVIAFAEFKAGAAEAPLVRVRADPRGLEIVGPPVECPSIGRAKTVWANVRIPAERLVSE